jgi:hypothetical protein
LFRRLAFAREVGHTCLLSARDNNHPIKEIIMATKSTAAVEELETETAVEPTTKQLINDGIKAVIDATGIDVQKNRYKAMRAIAFQAFSEAIESGDFDDLVQRAIANVDELPAGWEIERVEKDEAPAPKKAAAKPAAKAAQKTPVKKTAAKAGTARRRPTR